MKSLLPPLQLLQQHLRKGFIHVRCSECWSCVTCTARPFPFWYAKSDNLLLGGRKGIWSLSTLESYLTWYLVWIVNVYLFTYRHLIEGLVGHQSVCLEIRCIACFITLYHLEEIIPCDLYLVPSSLAFSFSIRKNPFHSQTLTVCLKKNPHSTHSSSVMSLSLLK